MIAPGTPAPYQSPADTEQAIASWDASCGPAALAAVLGVSLAEIRPHFKGYERRKYVNPTQMKEAMASLGCPFRIAQGVDKWVMNGVAFLQIDGPWNLQSTIAAYRHTHWVAVRGEWVYDVNADEWAPKYHWEREVMPFISRHQKGYGTWWARTGYEITGRLPCGSSSSCSVSTPKT